jgi:LuxR family maltose regulon positive regulatory protein
MGKKKPVVNKGRLTAYDAETGLSYSIRVGSKRWSNWLADNRTFIFEGDAGHFSARREMRRGMPYWYAYRRREGTLHKAYVGKAEDLTTDRLEQVSAQLAGQASPPRLPDTSNSQALLASLEKAKPASAHLDESAWSTAPFLLATKVQPPALPQNLMARPRLTGQMNGPLTLIDAPGGFGKSTLLNEWRSRFQTETRKLAWVSLDADDNEPGYFWMLVLSALQSASPIIGRTLPAHLPAPTPAALRQMVASLINAIAEGNHIALILDDYHHIQTDAIHQTVSFLLEHLPPALQLIISGRTKPPFALGRLRAKGLVVELNTEDLRFTEEEGIAFLQQQMRENPLALGEMQALVKRTEGWAAGLNLVTLALNRQADKHQFVATFAGEHTYLREYFMEDVLQQQPPSVQGFLLKTSILKHLTGDLCDAITGQTGGQQMLQRLWRDNLFLVQLGDGQTWYRYHDLFAQALHSQLQAQFPDEIPHLHRRAARWYQAQGSPADAVRHLLALEAWEEAATLIEGVALRELQQHGEDSRLLRWLKQLPVTVVQQHQTLLSVYIRLANAALSPLELAQFLERVEQNLMAKPSTDQTPNEQEVLAEINRIRRLQAAGEPLSLGSEASEADDEEWPMMDLLVQSQTFGRHLAHDKAEAAAFRAFEMARSRGNLFVTLMAGGSCAHRLFLQGYLRRSEQVAHHVLQWVLAQRDTLPEPASILLMVLGHVYFERDQLAQARHLMAQAAEVDPNPTSTNLPMMRSILLARLQVAQREFAVAQTTIRAALHLNKERPSGMWTAQDLRAYQALICFRQGDFAEAERVLNELRDTETHDGSMLTRAEVLLAQAQYVLAENILTTLIERYPHGLKNEPLLGVRLMLAMSLFGQQKINQARQVMVKAVRLAEPEEFVRPFLDRGSQIVPLLTLVLQTEKLSAKAQQFIKKILQTLRDSYGTEISMPQKAFSALSTAASISEREQEVLRFVAAGLSNKEIATRLFVADSTVKTHLRNIYRKLDVNSRVQAVTRARTLKLL